MVNPPRLDDMIEAIKRAHSDSLEQLSDAVQARRSGASWTDIGGSMGVTKQAAQQRFVPKSPGNASDLDPGQGFGRFTPRARNTVMAAHNEARANGNDEVRPEHLVLGLLSEPEGLAAKSIITQGISLETVRRATSAALPDDDPPVV